MIMLPLLHLFHLTFILLSLPQTASSTLLFYVPDSPSAPELTATIDYGITQFSRRLWYNLDHRVLAGGDGQSLVRSLVGNLENVTAFMGVFSDEELNSITPLVDAFGIPTFVLNQVTNFPTSPNIFLTTPSVEFEMKSLEGVLDYYKWDMISYFVEADSSVTDMLKGHGSCWDKHILDPSLIPKQTCKDFSVVILVGYSLFQNSFISHFTASGCRNMVVLQYYLEDSPSMVTADVRNSTEIGDLVMLFPKSYPIINTGVAPSENAKYSCLSPSCMQYKINSEYKQARSVLLLLDTLKLIEIPLREGRILRTSSLRDISFVSITGDQATLLDQGFSYNRMNIFKSGAVPGVELIGWSDERGLKILPTTWKSSASSEPLRNSSGSGCNLTVTSTPNPVPRRVAIDFRDPTKIVTVILLVVMLSSIPLIYFTRRNVVHKVPVGMIFPYLISCVVIVLTFFFLFEAGSRLLCLVMVVRDALEFIFYSLLLFSLISYESEDKFSKMTFIAILMLIKFIVSVYSLVKEATNICLTPYFSLSGSQLFFALITMTILFIVLKHFGHFRTIRWVVMALFASMTSEAVIHFANVPASVQVALYSTRIFLTTVAYVFSGRPRKDAGSDHEHFKDEKQQRNHINHTHNYMNLNGEAGKFIQTDCMTCVECPCEECPCEDYPCKHSEEKVGGGLCVTGSPQMYWEDDVELVHCPKTRVPPPPPPPPPPRPEEQEEETTDDEGQIGPFPERVRLDNVMGKEINSENTLLRQPSCQSFKSPVPAPEMPYTSSCCSGSRDESSHAQTSSGIDSSPSSSQCCIQPYPDEGEDSGMLLESSYPTSDHHPLNTPQDYTVHWSKPTEYGDEITCCYPGPPPPPHHLPVVSDGLCYPGPPPPPPHHLPAVSDGLCYPAPPPQNPAVSDVKCYHVSHLSEISEEEEGEEEETQIRVGFRSGEDDFDYNSDTHVTNGESGFCSGNSNTTSNSTEPEYVNIGNGGQSLLDDITLIHHRNNVHAMETA